MKSEKLYFQNLDAIRFIAAMMVFFAHSVRESLAPITEVQPLFKRVCDTFMSGGTGVSIFFVLSGFLISYLLIREKSDGEQIKLGKFYMRRVLRIWPLYYAVILFAFFCYPLLKLALGLPGQTDSNVVYQLFFLSNFDIIHLSSFDAVNTEMSEDITWSVAIEEQFYLFWPFIFLLNRKFWGWLILAVILFSFYFRMVNFDEKTILYYHTFAVIGDLGVGAGFAFLITQFEKIKVFFERSATKSHLLLILVIFTLLFFKDFLFEHPNTVAFYRLITSILFGAFITSQALTKKESWLNLSRLKRISALGKITYGIYLIHPIAILIIHVICNRILHFEYELAISTSLLINFLGFVLTLIMAKLSYRYLESRFLALKSKFDSQ